jgi:DNA-binding response OmpR family regulator
MNKPGVLVVAGDRESGHRVCSLLQELNYPTSLIGSLGDLEQELQKESEVAVILDLDTLPLNIRFFRGLRKSYPRLHLLGISELTYHPGLEEVIGSHLLACLVKPVDAEELGFWLKSIGEHLANPERAVPG